jgi:hypothetical protein
MYNISGDGINYYGIFRKSDDVRVRAGFDNKFGIYPTLRGATSCIKGKEDEFYVKEIMIIPK